MPSDVLMPKMGYDMTEGKISRWLKAEGDHVTRGEAIAEIETDKATIEIEAFVSGRLQKILAPPGQTVPVGQPIAIVETEAAAERPAPKPAATPPAEKVEAARPPEPTAAPAGPPAPAEAGIRPTTDGREVAEARLKASPIARRLAEEYQVDLRQVTGSGPGGRITKEDVEAFQQHRQAARPVAPPAAPAPAAAPPPAPEAAVPAAPPAAMRQPLSRMRQAIARRMAQSKQQAPHFYVTIDIDMAAALDLRQQLNQELPAEASISINDLVIKACAKTLPQFPDLNASFAETEIELHSAINIGIAVALEDGLIVPVLRDAERRPLPEIARESRRLAQAARAGRLSADDISGATFTVTNLGMFGVQNFIAIIDLPQAAILAVGAVEPRPVVRDGSVAVAHRMQATLSADHRVTDGARAARFLAELRRLLEHPAALLV